jgi:hypothetical protein
MSAGGGASSSVVRDPKIGSGSSSCDAMLSTPALGGRTLGCFMRLRRLGGGRLGR